MFQLIKSIIDNGNYSLHSQIEKIDRMYIEDKITLEERTTLTQLAMSGAEAQKESDMYQKLLELEQRIRAVEEYIHGGDTPVDIEDFVEGKWYYNGDKVRYNNKVYKCIAPDGVVCVWSPDVYPAYWQEIN